MDDYSTAIELNEKRFTRLTFYFWLSMASLLAIFIIPKDSSSEDFQLLEKIVFLTFAISHFIFACKITVLANAAGRVGILWFIGSSILLPFSSFTAYYRMQIIAIKNGWSK